MRKFNKNFHDENKEFIKYLLFLNTVLSSKHSHMTKYMYGYTPESMINIKIHALVCNEYLNSLTFCSDRFQHTFSELC